MKPTIPLVETKTIPTMWEPLAFTADLKRDGIGEVMRAIPIGAMVITLVEIIPRLDTEQGPPSMDAARAGAALL